MSRLHKIQFAFKKNKRLYISLLSLLVLLIVPLLGILIFEVKYSGRVYPNVYFYSQPISGKTREELAELVTRVGSDRLRGEVTYILDDGRVVKLGSVSDYASYDIARTVDSALAIGRTGSFGERVRSQFQLFRHATHVPIVFAYNRQAFEDRFNESFQSFEKPVVNSGLALQGDSVVLTSSRSGVVADREVAVSAFERYLGLQTPSSSFTISVASRAPEITETNAKDALGQVQNAVARSLTFSSPQLPGSTWSLNKSQLLSLIDLRVENSSVRPYVVDYKVASWSAQMAQLVNRDPVDAKFEYTDGKVKEFEAAQPGLELDTEELTNKISDASFNPSLPAEIEIPLKITQPALSTENVNTYGIKELVSTGKSKFVGSPSGRIHNINLAASRLNGALIAPGETFSMYKVVGEVEKSTGFEDAFVILNGRTVPGVGGGLCQVSTTLFRAVLNAGLPIVERHQHAYRVYYYEQDSAPGIDAAVYFPSWDFRFKNDTGSYLLLQTKIDTKKMTAEFNLYGVKDGRSVALTKPVVTNQAPPPPELRIDDPTLPRGQEKEVDHAVWGADTVFTRTVTKDGAEYLKDSFKSAYRPWQRVVMVGVKD